jgi:hypothetical protein
MVLIWCLAVLLHGYRRNCAFNRFPTLSFARLKEIVKYGYTNHSSCIFHKKKLLINIFVTGLLGGLVSVTGKLV